MERSVEQHSPSTPQGNEPLTPQRARELLESVPARPRRHLGARDHLSVLATAVLALATGLLSLSGHPWWAIAPAVAAIIVADRWVSGRKQRVGEPRLGAVMLVSAVFGAWLFVPIYRGIRHGEVIPFPEILILAGLAPAAWLVYYAWLLIRR